MDFISRVTVVTSCRALIIVMYVTKNLQIEGIRIDINERNIIIRHFHVTFIVDVLTQGKHRKSTMKEPAS